jgi:ATP-dependent RNA helicase DDX54/DBP10
MARTGSGKSLAFLVPLVQRLGGRHSLTFGARALILLPTRELALQILKVGKELARGWRDGEGGHAGDKGGDHTESRNRGQGLRWGLVVGGEGMDEQFEMMSNNPDVYATNARSWSDRSDNHIFFSQDHRHPRTTPTPYG